MDGLSVGNAFGNTFYKASNRRRIARQEEPETPWPWAADTVMADAVAFVLKENSCIVPDSFADELVRRFKADSFRGYSNAMFQILNLFASGQDWRYISPNFAENGLYGNEAAVRAVPIGAYFTGQPEKAAHQAEKSAVVTHYHREGRCGAMACATAASIAADYVKRPAADFLEAIRKNIPESQIKEGLQRALEIPSDDTPLAVAFLGNGEKATAMDTVPFALWTAAHHLNDYKQSLWAAVRGLGDMDTIAAIVGGITAVSAKHVDSGWLKNREPLPE